MEKKYLAKIIATENEGLQMISACCAGAKVKISDIKFLKSNLHILLIFLSFWLVSIFLLSTESKNILFDFKNLIPEILTFAPAQHAEINCKPSFSVAIIFAKYFFSIN